MSTKRKKPETPEELEKEEKRKVREAEAAAFLDDDDETDVGEVVSTARHYVKIPVGKAITGVYVQIDTFKDPNGNPQPRPVLLVAGETVVLPSHQQLISAFRKTQPGSTVKVACIEQVKLAGGKTTWNYRVSAKEPGGGEDLPF